MNSNLRTLSLSLSLFAATAACNTDPAPDVEAAKVGEATTRTEPAPDAPAEATHLAITPENSKIQFVGAKVTGKHNGSFEQFKGDIALKDQDPVHSAVTVTIQIASLVADDPKLTNHLKSPDLLDAGKFPEATFESTSITKQADGEATHEVIGNFTLHGVTKAISFPATIVVSEGEATAKAKFKINRKDFGITYPGMPDDLIEDQVLIELDLKASK